MTCQPCALRSMRWKYAEVHTEAKSASGSIAARTGARRSFSCRHASSTAAPYRSDEADAAVGDALGTALYCRRLQLKAKFESS